MQKKDLFQEITLNFIAFTGLNHIKKSLLSTVGINSKNITNKHTGGLHRHTQKTSSTLD